MTRARATAQTRGRDSGFTLVETLVALALIVTVMAASATLIVRAYMATQHNVQSDRAVQYATARIERIRQLDFHDIGFATPTYGPAVGSAPNPYDKYLPADDADSSRKERSVFLATTNTSQSVEPALPYERVTNDRDAYDIYTTITWGTDKELGLPLASGTKTTDPASNTASNDLYSFKRVTVTVEWTEDGKRHRSVNETTFAPREFHEAPPGVNVTIEGSTP